MKNEFCVLAGGCFWGMQDLIRKQVGIVNTTVGYTGGDLENPTYEVVKTGSSGHAEAIEIEFSPTQTTFKDILRFFFKIHDPTTINRQGNDRGSQYRSAIFYKDENQKRDAEQIAAEVDSSKFWSSPIKTALEPFEKFYPAESYHQDYLKKNPGGYTCHYVRT